MRIAICDDEDQERLNIEALVKRYAPELSIVLFSSADELLAAAKTTFFPLIFLDIDGTLLPPGEMTVPASAMEAIRQARANGHKVLSLIHI